MVWVAVAPLETGPMVAVPPADPAGSSVGRPFLGELAAQVGLRVRVGQHGLEDRLHGAVGAGPQPRPVAAGHARLGRGRGARLGGQRGRRAGVGVVGDDQLGVVLVELLPPIVLLEPVPASPRKTVPLAAARLLT